MPTHKEKDDLISKLKDELKNLSEKMKSTIKTGEFDTQAVSIIKEGGVYTLIKLDFGMESGECKVIKKLPCGKDPSKALYLAKKFLVEDILKDAKKS